MITSAREQPTTIGELDGRRSSRVEAFAAALRGAGVPVVICSRMEAWLKTHAAEVSPTVNALCMSAGERLGIVRTRDNVVLMLRAIREGYQVLRRLDIPITPANHRLFECFQSRCSSGARREVRRLRIETKPLPKPT